MSDFETVTNPLDCRVWLWGIVPVVEPESRIEWGTTFESFAERIAQHNSMVYFHNLKFDGGFILDWLLNNGFTHVSGSRKGMERMQFTSLISDMNKHYSYTVKWATGNTTEFRDSFKKIPMSVRTIAKTFQMDISKGEIDYDAPRPIGYEPTNEELNYLERDLRIPARALKTVIESGMTRLTVASDSLAEYKRLNSDAWFRRTFPVLSDEQDAEIRRAYRGGFTYADPRFSKRKLSCGIVLDVNSLYPSVMYNELMPYGEPEFVEGKVEPTERRPLTIFSVTFTATVKKDHVPCIQIKGSSIFGGTEYLTDIPDPTTLMVTNVDWELYLEQYDVHVLAYGGGWRFHAVKGLFKTYIDKWAKRKAETTGGEREVCKLHLNSLYGKFASNPNVTGKVPVLRDGVVRYVRGPEERRAPVYTAVGVFVTSFARALTIRAAQANYKNFRYADTDSLHLTMDKRWTGVYVDDKTGVKHKIPGNIDVHPTRMGAWKFEYEYAEAFYVRPKAYLNRKHDGSFKVAWAGIPDSVQEKFTFDTLVNGSVITGKLEQMQVPGGVVLQDKPYTLNL
jgi:hypothetical protein